MATRSREGACIIMAPSDQPATPAAMWGAMLKHYREHVGFSQEKLAKEIAYSAAQVASIETGRRTASREFAKLCDTALKAGGALLRLHEMILSSAVLGITFRDWPEIERRAVMLRGFESTLVPSLLQIREYMEVVLQLDGPQAVEARMSRQLIFSEEHPPVVRYVIGEWVLCRPIGNTEIMRRQLEHIEAMADNGTVHVQVLPLHALPGINGAFSLATVDGRTVAYEESTTRVQILTQKEDLLRLEVIYDRLLAEAYIPAESLERLRIMKEKLWIS